MMMWEEGFTVGAMGKASVLETGLHYIQKETRPTSREFSLSIDIDGRVGVSNRAQNNC